ncbi:MAG: DUF4032 domain-containing protein [Kiritimatiellae bacterium]|nr:DUF4032 domain-containing protein [Kiritimatiellia bacterium]MDW8458767.1 hypothetical protein [Verrucomicrobiota bacterium]
MANQDPNHCSSDVEAWVRRTLVVQQWERIKQEILLHKWYESERAGYDIGWERASVDWLVRYGCRRHLPPSS